MQGKGWTLHGARAMLLRMNVRHFVLLASLLAAGAAFGQKPQVTVAAKQKLDGDTEQKATRYSNTKEKDRSCELTIQVRNGDAAEQKVKLSWYFVGNPLVGGLSNFVYDKGEADLSLPPRYMTNLVEKSKEIGSKVATGRHKVTKSGAKHMGFIVTVAQDTNLLGVAASPAGLEKIARNTEELTKLLTAPAPP